MCSLSIDKVFFFTVLHVTHPGPVSTAFEWQRFQSVWTKKVAHTGWIDRAHHTCYLQECFCLICKNDPTRFSSAFSQVTLRHSGKWNSSKRSTPAIFLELINSGINTYPCFTNMPHIPLCLNVVACFREDYFPACSRKCNHYFISSSLRRWRLSSHSFILLRVGGFWSLSFGQEAGFRLSGHHVLYRTDRQASHAHEQIRVSSPDDMSLDYERKLTGPTHTQKGSKTHQCHLGMICTACVIWEMEACRYCMSITYIYIAHSLRVSTWLPHFTMESKCRWVNVTQAVLHILYRYCRRGVTRNKMSKH